MELVIIDSARKRGIADEDIRHVVEFAIQVELMDEGLRMFIGPTRSGELWEAGVVSGRDFDGLVAVHAMPARSKFLK